MGRFALTECPECGGEVSERAVACPHCGAPLRAPVFAYEYRSAKEVWGWPLVHIAYGFDAATGRPLVAKGIVAVGAVAIGVLAVGSVAVGVFSVAGVGLGLFTFAGMAAGLVIAAGGLATGLVAVGGVAVGFVAIGGLAIGWHALGANVQDPWLMGIFRRIGRL